MPLKLRLNPNSYFARLTFLKKLFWLYFFLLIFEGALRKWVAPQWSAPILVIRDPVSVWIIWEAYRTRKWPSRWTVPIVALTILMAGLFSLQIAINDNMLLVGLYGLRSYLLPFPVAFIMGENLDDEDLLNLGRCTLWILLPMCLLCVAQYLASPSAFINKGAYKGGEQIDYVVGHARASGTFSFVAGLENFATLAGAFIFYAMIREELAKKWLTWASALALILIIPTAGSRALVVSLVAMLACVAMSAMMGVSQFTKALRIIVPLLLVWLLASRLPIFNRSMQSMTDRVSGATALEGGTVQESLFIRIVQPEFDAIEAADAANNWMGIGLGRGAIAVQAFLTGSTRGVTGESEFSHELMEMGPIAGGMFQIFKLLLAVVVFGQAFARAREQEPFALLLCPLALSLLLLVLLEQPTSQGFTVTSLALCIAAARRPMLARVPMTAPILRQQRALQLLWERQQAFRRRRMQSR